MLLTTKQYKMSTVSKRTVNINNVNVFSLSLGKTYGDAHKETGKVSYFQMSFLHLSQMYPHGTGI